MADQIVGRGHDISDPKQSTKAQIEAATSVAEIADIRNKLGSLQEYARQSRAGLEKVNDIAETRVEAECKGGLLLRDVERSGGGRPAENSSDDPKSLSPYQQELSEAGLRYDTAHRWQVMSWSDREHREEYYEKQRKDERTITSEDVFRLGKKAIPHEVVEPVMPNGKYETIVIDPPWPMQKIERDTVPYQAGFEYPTMTEEELAAFPLPEMMADDCHVFMWTTQKFRPMADRLFIHWDIKYILEMVWHKPGGFQPFGLPQYNCEFILYGRRGSPEFVDTKDFFCCFDAPRREHSRKPDAFYETIARVTAGPRIDIFSRELRDGFDQYGNQTDEFARELF